MAFPATKDAPAPPPPPPKTHERNWTCSDEELNGGVNCCDAVLKTRFVGIRTDPKNPSKFVPICEKCAKLEPKAPTKPTHYRFTYLMGLLSFPILWWGIPLIWRLVK